MKIFYPTEEQIGEGYQTCFTFDDGDNDEETDFINWLQSMSLDYTRSKIPMTKQTCIIIPTPENDENDDEGGLEEVEDTIVEEKPKKGKRKEKE